MLLNYRRIFTVIRSYSDIIAAWLFLTGCALLFFGTALDIPVAKSATRNLWGHSPLVSVSILLIAFAPILYASHFLRRKSVDWLSITLFIIAAIVSLHYIHISNDGAYTNDMPQHWRSINFIADHWPINPFGKIHHPPLYYYLSGAVVWFVNQVGTISAFTAVRFLSWMCFIVFYIYSLLALRETKLPRLIYYASAALLLFWPGGLHIASKISPEPLYFACYAAAFYYAVVWYHKGNERALMKAIVIVAVAITIKRNAFILVAVIGILAIIALFRRRLLLKDFLAKRWIMVCMFFALCFLINMALVLFYHYPLHLQLGIKNWNLWPISHYLTLHFDAISESPFNTGESNQSFWDYLFKTSLFGEYTWPSPQLATALNFLLIAIFWYTVLPWLFAARVQWRGMMPYVLSLVVSILFIIKYFMGVNYLAGQDARYIYPSLVCFVVLFGKSCEMYREKGALVLTWLGPILAFSFAALSAYFFWNNAR